MLCKRRCVLSLGFAGGLEGAPEPSLLRAIETLRPGLLVLGTHGRTGLPHALFGSVAEAMTRNARCDVLVVRLEKPAFSLP